MSTVASLMQDIERARREYLAPLASLTETQGAWKPAEDVWSVIDNTEHLYRAEQAGISLIWTAADGVRRGTSVWKDELPHRGLSIETIVERTWAPRAIAPESARPQWGGPLSYWLAALQSNAPMLVALAPQLEGLDLDSVVYPHPISGPLDARQRLEFLRFHIDRHRDQVKRLMATSGFPA